jgi:hypothetical protein
VWAKAGRTGGGKGENEGDMRGNSSLLKLMENGIKYIYIRSIYIVCA